MHENACGTIRQLAHAGAVIAAVAALTVWGAAVAASTILLLAAVGTLLFATVWAMTVYELCVSPSYEELLRIGLRPSIF